MVHSLFSWPGWFFTSDTAFLDAGIDRGGRLFDKRSLVFGDFMNKLNDAIESLTNSVRETDTTSLADDVWADAVWKYFYPVYNSGRVVRQFLSESDREAFIKLLNLLILPSSKLINSRLVT